MSLIDELAADNCDFVDEENLFYEHLLTSYGKVQICGGVSYSEAAIFAAVDPDGYDKAMNAWLNTNPELVEIGSRWYYAEEIEAAKKELIAAGEKIEALDFSGATEGDR